MTQANVEKNLPDSATGTPWFSLLVGVSGDVQKPQRKARPMCTSSHASDVSMTSTYYRATFLLLRIVHPDQPIKGTHLYDRTKKGRRGDSDQARFSSSFVECGRHTRYRIDIDHHGVDKCVNNAQN
eukprot:scaffold53042_cov51-Attheya_sp.AAC.3